MTMSSPALGPFRGTLVQGSSIRPSERRPLASLAMELGRALFLFAIVLGLAAIATLKFDLPTRGEHE